MRLSVRNLWCKQNGSYATHSSKNEDVGHHEISQGQGVGDTSLSFYVFVLDSMGDTAQRAQCDSHCPMARDVHQ